VIRRTHDVAGRKAFHGRVQKRRLRPNETQAHAQQDRSVQTKNVAKHSERLRGAERFNWPRTRFADISNKRCCCVSTRVRPSGNSTACGEHRDCLFRETIFAFVPVPRPILQFSLSGAKCLPISSTSRSFRAIFRHIFPHPGCPFLRRVPSRCRA